MEFFATCARGLEALLGDELRSLRIGGVRPVSGGVNFTGTNSDAYKALLWSRIASRVLLTLARYQASDADALYAGAYEFAWENHIVPKASIAINARGTTSQLRDSRFTALRVKDALFDRLRKKDKTLPKLNPKYPDLRIDVVLHRGKVTISLDLSGAALHMRGYRGGAKSSFAPLRETMAAALLRQAGWHKRDGEAMLFDPMCGSGTLCIEAALMAADVAPQITRTKWGFEAWKQHNQTAWNCLIDEADERAEAGIERLRNAARDAGCKAFVYGSDIDPYALEIAQHNARAAGVDSLVKFECCDIADNKKMRTFIQHADYLVCNPPYGERLSNTAQLPALYAPLANATRMLEPDYVCLISPDDSIDAFLQKKCVAKVETYNGPIEVSIRLYNAQSDVKQESHTIHVRDKELEVFDKGAQQFASRLNKVAKQRKKWATKHGVYAYRVYDKDLPDYNLAIDVFECKDSGRKIHISEYAPPKQIDVQKTTTRLVDALSISEAVFEVSSHDIFMKTRRRAKGGSQYAARRVQKQSINKQNNCKKSQLQRFETQQGSQDSEHIFQVKENKMFFEVNLADYLDCGLFLDHRKTRSIIKTLARGKSFLNLFAYTGSVSVYAVFGGAEFTTTVDISNTYLSWAQRNFELNGFNADFATAKERRPSNELVREDAIRFIARERQTKHRWDLIFVDPPTFSNSSKMGRRTWDVQKDHAELLIGASRLLRKEGVIVFSCNLKNFKLDAKKLASAGVVAHDITAKTIPTDFERTPHVHHCFLLQRVPMPH